jgi:hypothetical protein
MKKKLGRKTLLTAHLQKKLCALLENANTVKTACGACGISERVFYEWAAEKPHFAQATNRARSLAKIRLIGIIMAAAPKDWRAAMELLSRLAPAEFGRVWRSEPVPSQETAIPVQFFLPREDGTTVEVPTTNCLRRNSRLSISDRHLNQATRTARTITTTSR